MSSAGFLPRKSSDNIYIEISAIPELKEIKLTTEYPSMEYIYVGAGVTITELKDFLQQKLNSGK